MQMKSGTTRWLLIGSLVVNVFLVGVVAGGQVRGRTVENPLPPPGQALRLRQLLSPLPEERRRNILEGLRGERRHIRPMIVDIQRARQDVMAALSADPIDVEVLKAAIDRMRLREQTLREASFEISFKVVEGLTKEEQRMIADGALARIQRRIDRDRKRRSGQTGG